MICVKKVKAIVFMGSYFNNSQTAPMIFFHIFCIIVSNYLIKNPQTTIALTFLTHIISAIGGVLCIWNGKYSESLIPWIHICVKSIVVHVP